MLNKKIEILVRAIIQKEGGILVCKKIGKRCYFFSGGHVEYGESSKIKNHFGSARFKMDSFVKKS